MARLDEVILKTWDEMPRVGEFLAELEELRKKHPDGELDLRQVDTGYYTENYHPELVFRIPERWI